MTYWLVGYTAIFCGIFGGSVVTIGWQATLLGFGVTLGVCTLAGALLWWQDE